MTLEDRVLALEKRMLALEESSKESCAHKDVQLIDALRATCNECDQEISTKDLPRS